MSNSIAWIPGENFDPHDPDEMEIMRFAWESERIEYTMRLEQENERLRSELERERELRYEMESV